MENIDYLIEELLKEDKNLTDIEIPKSLEEKKKLYRALRNIRNPKPISEEYLKKQDEYLLRCFSPNHYCIDNAIHSFAGMQLREECNNIMKEKTLPNGEAVLTNAYNLPCKYIIQTVGPIVHEKPTTKDEEDLRNCYYNSLKLSQEKGLRI